MRDLREPHDAAELFNRGRDPLVIRCNDHGVDATRTRCAPIDVLDHRAASNLSERLARES